MAIIFGSCLHSNRKPKTENRKPPITARHRLAPAPGGAGDAGDSAPRAGPPRLRLGLGHPGPHLPALPVISLAGLIPLRGGPEEHHSHALQKKKGARRDTLLDVARKSARLIYSRSYLLRCPSRAVGCHSRSQAGAWEREIITAVPAVVGKRYGGPCPPYVRIAISNCQFLLTS